MRLFHYHLVTTNVRRVEARYIGKLAFALVARHGRIGEDYQSFSAGTSWEELDELGFKLRLSELERGGVNVVVQPGQWDLPPGCEIVYDLAGYAAAGEPVTYADVYALNAK